MTSQPPRTFRQLLAAPPDERWPLSRLIDALAEACRSLAAAHARGVIHQNISPDAIVIDPAGRATLRDRDTSQDSGERPKLGVPGYVAPELVRGERSAASAQS